MTGLLTASSAVMMESFFDKSDMDLASIDCSCRPVMSVCNRQQTKHYEMKLEVDGKPGRECLSQHMHRWTNKLESSFDKSDKDLASIDCSCIHVKSVCQHNDHMEWNETMDTFNTYKHWK